MSKKVWRQYPDQNHEATGSTRRSISRSIKLLAMDLRSDSDRPTALEKRDVARAKPRTLGECGEYQTRCPFVGCKWHLYLDVTEVGSLRFNFPGMEPLDLENPCTLKAADANGLTLEETGSLMHITRERVRQIEVQGLEQIKALKFFEEGSDNDPWTSTFDQGFD